MSNNEQKNILYNFEKINDSIYVLLEHIINKKEIIIEK